MSFVSVLREREREYLSPCACLSENCGGRSRPISECDLRGEFQRDRDRIVHSKAFRRLMGKTQVFLAPEPDHFRTRLTHTMEVTQIARTIARALRLNEDLCEAISLGHDLGHTPFGHAGERVLQKCYDKNFAHYRQSIRVVEVLEPLDLSEAVLDGIINHTNGVARTLEGRIVRIADRIAYINHDIDDACRAGILDIGDIPAHLRDILGDTHGKRIDSMVRSVIRASGNIIADAEKNGGSGDILLEAPINSAMNELHEFLFENVYRNPVAKGEEGRASAMLEQLYVYFTEHPDELPSEFETIKRTESEERAVCDYISGMTDRYAINTFRELFIPEAWKFDKFDG